MGAQDGVSVLRSDFAIKIPEVLFDFENLGVLVFLEFEEVKQTNRRLLFLVDVAQNIYLLNILVLFNL